MGQRVEALRTVPFSDVCQLPHLKSLEVRIAGETAWKEYSVISEFRGLKYHSYRHAELVKTRFQFISEDPEIIFF
jgi:hypothetical protein